MKDVYDIQDMICNVSEQMRHYVRRMDFVPADDLGLDRRAAYRLWVDKDCIIVDKEHDSTLQYYGGFEYVDKEYRTEIDDYVIYLRDDERVDGHLRYYYEEELEEFIYNDNE